MGSLSGLPMSSFNYLCVLVEESRPVLIAKKAKIKETNLLSPYHHEYCSTGYDYFFL
jgi:hypothetical protein